MILPSARTIALLGWHLGAPIAVVGTPAPAWFSLGWFGEPAQLLFLNLCHSSAGATTGVSALHCVWESCVIGCHHLYKVFDWFCTPVTAHPFSKLQVTALLKHLRAQPVPCWDSKAAETKGKLFGRTLACSC